ncbi:hypothetical protein [Actinoplanes couchii]|uniref:Uncharacterized protein n=1 Tax=Actinoplanes couchii TaxID=403638 RepID=A0ABQ3XMK8_9ACTN|nr:hypothetical protein [Actinoplanes couchii]MDR6321639.1 hypothetical protein [Actinoplanes couchii]GID59734.1 hypothetical protein Aco03nite_081380 [Actinoplanes couchii]
MGTMLIEDVFAAPGGGTAVAGRVVGGPIRLGDTLWLRTGHGHPTGERQHSDSDVLIAVLVVRFLRLCGRQDSPVAPAGENTAIVLGGDYSPPELAGLTLHSSPDGL